MTRALRYYGKPDCPLCDKGRPLALELADRFGFVLEFVDIRTDAELERRFGEMIPVLEFAGDVLGWGLLSRRALERKFIAMAVNE